MPKQVLFAIWLVCMVASLALFWIGIGRPYTESRALAKEQVRLTSDPAYLAEVEARQEAARPNYWIGAAAPAVILIGSMILFSRVPARK